MRIKVPFGFNSIGLNQYRPPPPLAVSFMLHAYEFQMMKKKRNFTCTFAIYAICCTTPTETMFRYFFFHFRHLKLFSSHKIQAYDVCSHAQIVNLYIINLKKIIIQYTQTYKCAMHLD